MDIALLEHHVAGTFICSNHVVRGFRQDFVPLAYITAINVGETPLNMDSGDNSDILAAFNKLEVALTSE